MKVFLLILVLSFLCLSKLNCNTDSTKVNNSFIKYNGAIGISSDYQSNTLNKDQLKYRNSYSDQLSLRGNANLNITLFDQIQLPFEFWFTTSQIGFQQPFNQFGVNPKFGDWLTLHAGYFYTNYSDLTFGDSRILGTGIDLNLSIFKISTLFGRMKEFRDNDSLNNTLGSYKRMVSAVKVGFGISNDLFVNLNFVKAWDDTTQKMSFRYDNLPKDNLVGSLAIGIPIASVVKFSCEGAFSLFSNDINSEKYENPDIPSFSKFIFEPRYSTQIDGSAKASLILTPLRNYTFKFNAKWIGPGYQTLGYPSLFNDVFDLTFAPNMRFFNGNLTLKGSIGYRENNLRSNRKSNTKRIIGSVDIFSQINEHFNLSAQYSNYGMQTNYNRDTIHLQNISEIFQINPNINFTAFNANNNLMFSFSYQDITDKSTIDTIIKKYITNMANFNYSLSYDDGLMLTTGVFYNQNKSEFNSKIFSFTETIGYSFFDKLLNTNLTVGFTLVEFTKTDTQISLRLNASYSLNKFGSFTLNISNMNYKSDNSANYYQTPGSYNEIIGTIGYAITF